jgi:TATA-binding protein-associated factor Taf7
MGMVSRVAEMQPYDFISFEHLGIYKNGVEDTESVEAKKWSPAFENYSFEEVDGKTKISVDQDIQSEYKEMFEGMWEKALNLLKELAEK